MDMDPVELRRRNLLRGDEMPYFNANGMPYDHVAPADTFEQAVKILDHEGFPQGAEGRAGAGPLHRSRILGVRRADRGAATGHLASEGATIRMEPTGKINVYVNGGSTGNSIETTVVQLTADALGADIDDVSTIQGDTAVTPYGAGTQGSRSGPMTAGAVNEAGTHAPQAAHRHGGARLERRRRRHRAGELDGPSVRTTREERELRRHRVPVLLRTVASCRRNGGALEATARFTSPDDDSLGQRDARLHLRSGHRKPATSR